MMADANSADDFWNQMKMFFLGVNDSSGYADEEPLRAELFSHGQMAQHSKALARKHVISKKRLPDRLLTRLADNEKVLLEVRNLLTQAVKENSMITPAGEWLLDNFYLIEEQVRTAKKHLPKVYSEGLPQLVNGPSADLPRVYDIALEIISHSDGRVDQEGLNHFIQAYQEVTFFQIGELWAVPIMLRLALIENLRRVCSRIAVDRINRSLADYWAKKMIDTATNDAKNLILVVADMARSNPPLESAFVAELSRQLRGKGPVLNQALNWIEERLAETGRTSNELVQAENQRQAADQVSVSNSISSLRLLGSMDWRDFVEGNSAVEKILREDDVYPLMDFATRDHYRHVVESIAKNAKLPEPQVARLVINASKTNERKGQALDKSTHVGYYLIGAGKREAEKMANMHLPLREKMARAFAHFPLFNYSFAIFIITFGVSGLLTYKAYSDKESIWVVAVFGLLSVICASQMAVTLVNFITTLLVHPSLLPRMDFSEGVPDDARTLVAVPTMLTSKGDIESLTEALEVRYLANKDNNLFFGLVTDFLDAPSKDMPDDEFLLQTACNCIEALNKKHSKERNNLFYLFHRPRKWNPGDNVWMGYERKRGKLADLNGLLRGNSHDAFSSVVGNIEVLKSVKYVITLDSDTQLPRESAWKIIGAMAHPLNRAVFDEKKGIVTEGYGILQPRVSISMPGPDSSLYARINGNEPALDPYTRATSDVYQDLFEEGSFIGKGIYEVDIFEKALKGKFPENRILSHDLLEGCYVRSGLMSDVQLFENHPSSYHADMKRRHRWIRGDWQIAAWFTPFVPGADKRLHINPLSALSRWKIFDNIRRSLIPFALTLFVLLCWTLGHKAAIWTLIITGMIILPVVVSSLWDMLRKPKDLILSHHLIVSGRSAGNSAIVTLFITICLPYEAWVSMEVIAVTAWRMLISHKNLLKWISHDRVERSGPKTLAGAYITMWIEPLLAIASLSYLLYIHHTYTLEIAGPVIFLWLIGPFITWWVSKPLPVDAAELTAEEAVYLRKLARKTWGFFEEFVNEKENWLPPDNYQENPGKAITHRTSPTNIGMALLANLTAYDFGYIGAGEFAERTRSTLSTMQAMEKSHGHLYNWYDTQTLIPCHPKYISTVDSGNLAGHLMTLRQGILAIGAQPVISPMMIEGLRDTLRVLSDYADKKHLALLRSFKEVLEKPASEGGYTLLSVKNHLLELQDAYKSAIDGLPVEDGSDAHWWKEALGRQVQKHLDEIKGLAPWLFVENLPDSFNNISGLNTMPTLFELARLNGGVEGKEVNELKDAKEKGGLESLHDALAETAKRANERISELEQMAQHCSELADIEFEFLYNRQKNLLTIGYNVDEHRADASFYDLLASEARLTIFVGIAQGKLPQESWFSLGRLLTNAGGQPILLSWSGSMFEYLMPLLVMPSYENTLLNQTDEAAVSRQIEYGKQRGVPWGVSESCYNLIDAGLNYQYRAFGVPGLGLKRGLGEDLVIAPYATALALMVMPAKACDNLLLMREQGFEGRYGFYEAVDYTPSRLPRGQNNVIVQSFMAHHQGMSFLSMAYLLLDQPMQKRFAAETQFRAALLLLQERIPKATSFFAHTTNIADTVSTVNEPHVRVINTPTTPIPEVQLLSNGNYHVMITNSGGGYSRWRDLAVTRWREDATRDNRGVFCYIRDFETGGYFSTTFQPVCQRLENFEVAFSQGRADFRGAFNKIDTHTEIVVSPEDDIEMRRLNITNRSGRTKVIDITSYAEVVIAHAAADASHQTFSNLFVQTEIVAPKNAIICTRRPKSTDEKPPWMFHLMNMHGKRVETISYETDRAVFTGRGNTPANPAAMKNTGALEGNQGSVLDPIAAIRYKVELEADETIIVDMIYGAADTREACQALIDKYQDKSHKDRVFELAWTHNQVVLRQINATESDAQLYCKLANSVIYINPALRAEPAILVKNNRGQNALWPYSISGDLPIVLLKIEDYTDMDLVRQMIQAHTYWRLKGLSVDLVIWNDSHDGYRQVLQNEISGLIGNQTTDKPGGIFVRSSDQISSDDRVLFQTVARAIITTGGGSLTDQVNRRGYGRAVMPAINPTHAYIASVSSVVLPADLLFFNGYGGFSKDGREYVIGFLNGKMTPAPWVNVIANPDFGTVISESGQCYSWAENAHEMRLTPWENDPVSDSGGEAFYIRDEESGHYWSPTPLPSAGKSAYIIRHGFGYSVFEHEEGAIYSQVWVYVDVAASVKFTRIKLKNNSGRPRRISVTGYTEWVLGELRPKSAMYITTEIDAESGAMFARNPYNTEFAGRVAFFDAEGAGKTFTGDRNEFIGRNGSLKNPAAMSRVRLSGKIGVSLDPCAAIQVYYDLAEEQEKDVAFKLGEGKNWQEASDLAKRFRSTDSIQEALDKVIANWRNITEALHVETPDAAVNMMANGWLTYQTLASRMWGRSGFYQSGGAFGFRDQLQDVLSLMQAEPQIARAQLLLAASRQFKEGDVQHWWHPPLGRGVRTRCCDDFLWLAFVTNRYVIRTGDWNILNEWIPFLEGRQLNPGEESYYDMVPQSDQHATLYMHCVRAIKNGLHFGSHGLPLMGTGDWNDGMDRVGRQGKGESVWMAFFMYDILTQFKHVAEVQKDADFAAQCENEARKLKENVEKNAWDGNWYRRAYFDDGTPLGSASNAECQIDSLSQSWAILSGVAGAERASSAMNWAYKRLVRPHDNLIQLLDPAFDKSGLDPGYIKGYVPGVRENGGQYTQAAVWLTMAFAKMGNSKVAWQLLDMLNPINHAKTQQDVAIYKVEPYVIAADVYAVSPLTGRGGWTWYTGSAGWTNQLITEWLLGIHQEEDKLLFNPCVPEAWQSYHIRYRYKETWYEIEFTQNPGTGNMVVMLDGHEKDGNLINLLDDRNEHKVEVSFFHVHAELQMQV
jgi:cellobiose phosphorylase